MSKLDDLQKEISALKRENHRLEKELAKVNYEFSRVETMLCPSWADELRQASKNDRSKAYDIAHDAISTFEDGETQSALSKALMRLIDENTELVGFAPSVSYVRKNGVDLDVLHMHPLGQRTLLFKIKEWPALLIVNSSIEFNKSALDKIAANDKIRGILALHGISG